MSSSVSRRKLFENLVAILRGDLPEHPADLEREAYWQALLPLADLHRVVAALPSALAHLGVTERVPDDVTDLLNAVHDLNAERNRQIAEQGLDVLSVLEGAEIQACPLKGLAYEIIGLHENPGVRVVGDIDILVGREDASRAFEILIGHGYSPKSNAPINEKHEHHFPMLRAPSDSDLIAPVEVHIRLGRQRHLDLLAPHKIIECARETSLDGRSVRTPQPIDLLQHAVVHSGLQHQYLRRRTTRLRDVHDIGRLWKLVKQDGHRLSDLPIARHPRAAQYFGACLLLYGRDPKELDTISEASIRCHARILSRQSIPEMRKLEVAISANMDALIERPLYLFKKFTRLSYYSNILNSLRSRST